MKTITDTESKYYLMLPTAMKLYNPPKTVFVSLTLGDTSDSIIL